MTTDAFLFWFPVDNFSVLEPLRNFDSLPYIINLWLGETLSFKMNLSGPNFDMINMTKCVLSSCESSQESIENILFDYRSGCICIEEIVIENQFVSWSQKKKKSCLGGRGVAFLLNVWKYHNIS